MVWLTRNSLCRPKYPISHRDPPAPVFLMLGSKAYDTMARLFYLFKIICAYKIFLHVCMHVYAMQYPGTAVRDVYRARCWFWELRLGPKQEQPIFLSTDPALQPANCFTKIKIGNYFT